MRVRNVWLSVLLSLLAVAMVDALELPETGISYEIEVQLDPETRRLDGRETIRWTNPSQTTLDRMPLHLYLNAFAHERTTWMRGIPPGRFDIDKMVDRFDDPWGWSEPTSIRRDGDEVHWEPIRPDDGNPLDQIGRASCRERV